MHIPITLGAAINDACMLRWAVVSKADQIAASLAAGAQQRLMTRAPVQTCCLVHSLDARMNLRLPLSEPQSRYHHHQANATVQLFKRKLATHLNVHFSLDSAKRKSIEKMLNYTAQL